MPKKMKYNNVTYRLLNSVRNLKQIVREQQDVAVLDLEPLQLQVGSSLRLLIRATDTLPEKPNSTDSVEFLLRVVSAEELRADFAAP